MLVGHAVYVIDDNPNIRRSTHLMLSASGYEVTCFASGVDFLDRANELIPGVALLDLRMPGFDGLEVLRALVKDYPRFCCIIITGHGEIEVAVESIKLGAKDFLEKPFREAAMLKILEREFRNIDAAIEFELTRGEAGSLVSRLTPREREVFHGMVKGKPNKAIAYELGRSIRTIEMHRANLMEKLGCNSLAEVVRIAIYSDEAVSPPPRD